MTQEKQKKSCSKRCTICQHRDKKTNLCKVKSTDCTDVTIDFAKCNDFVVDEKLSMF